MNYEMQETRGSILRLLKTQSSMTVSQLAEALGISSMGVRQHLAILERDGFVEHYREKPQRGRPTHLYHLTDKGKEMFPAAYGKFAVSLLKEAEKLNGCEFIDKLFQSRMKSQIDLYKPQINGKVLIERLEVLTQIRNEEGYMAEITEEEEDYVLTEYNCPLAMVVDKYPHACETELALFRQSLDANVRRVDHLMGGSHKCSYRIAKPSKDNE